MKSLFTLLIALLSVTAGFAQRMVDSAFFSNGVLQSYGHYDSTRQYWNLYSFYKDGKMASVRKLEPVHFQDCDSSIAYNPNGQIAWILPHKEGGYITGKFEEFYPSGKLKCTGNYYRGFKTGTWLEYYPEGQLKTESHFLLTSADSSFNRHLTKADYETGFAVNETLSWGETDTTVALKPDALYFPIHYTFTILLPQKTRVWTHYDKAGKIIRRIKYNTLGKKKPQTQRSYK
ncbi:MAG: hypothetical protein J7621_23765 [Niastella sp.]|nr:hypothetical protein [Niastella sp.]